MKHRALAGLALFAAALGLAPAAAQPAAERQQPSYVGRWAGNPAWCARNPRQPENMPVEVTRNSMHYYENSCRITQITGGPHRWRATLFCQNQGSPASERRDFHIAHDVMIMTFFEGDRIVDEFGYYRCPAAARRR